MPGAAMAACVAEGLGACPGALAEFAAESSEVDRSGKRFERPRLADSQPFAVGPGPLARRGGRRPVRTRVVDPPGAGLAVEQVGDDDGEWRAAGGEVGGSIDRIDDPDRSVAGSGREPRLVAGDRRSEEHTSEAQSLMRRSYP